MDRWKGKVAIVTGASGGIGAGICKELVRMGLIVCGLSKRVDKVEALRAELGDVSGQLNAVACDIRSESSVCCALTWIANTFGSYSLLINNAGVMTNHLLLENDNTRDLVKLVETSLIGLLLITKKVISKMSEQHTVCYVININSLLGHQVNTVVPGIKPINGCYPVAKYGVTALTEYLKQEINFSNLNINLCSISPGLTENDMLIQPKPHDLIKYMPQLQVKDIADAIQFIITRTVDVNVANMIIRPARDFL